MVALTVIAFLILCVVCVPNSLSNDAMDWLPTKDSGISWSYSHMFMATVLHFVLRVIFEAELTLKIN